MIIQDLDIICTSFATICPTAVDIATQMELWDTPTVSLNCADIGTQIKQWVSICYGLLIVILLDTSFILYALNANFPDQTSIVRQQHKQLTRERD